MANQQNLPRFPKKLRPSPSAEEISDPLAEHQRRQQSVRQIQHALESSGQEQLFSTPGTREQRGPHRIKGSSYDVRARRNFLVKTYGDGNRFVNCAHCGRKLDVQAPPSHPRALTVDKIKTEAEQGRYNRGNILPSCSNCNNIRNSTPMNAWATSGRPTNPLLPHWVQTARSF